MIEGSTIRGDIRSKLRIKVKMGVYANSSLDIPELGDIIFMVVYKKKMSMYVMTIHACSDKRLTFQLMIHFLIV